MFGRTARRITRRQVYFDEETYIPLNREERKLICSKLTVPQIGQNDELFINVLDPYCGTGEMFLDLAQSLSINAFFYGVERNKENRKQAKKYAKKVVLGTYSDLRCTNSCMSLIIFNPPMGAYNALGLPREAVAFGDLSFPGKYLYPGAVMVTIVRPEILKDIAQLMSLRFVDIEVGRLHGGRIAVFGVRSKGRVEPELTKKQKELLTEISECPDKAPFLDLNKKYTIPPTNVEVTTFRGYILDEEELAEEVQHSSLWKKVEEVLESQAVRTIQAPKPLLPLNTTHIAIAAAAGVINGRTRDHIRKGITKEYIESLSVEEDDTVTTIETKRYVSRVRIFSRDGVFDLEY